MTQFASNAVLINGPQYLSDNVTILHICKSPLKSDNLSQIQGKSFASVAFSSSDITIGSSGDDVTVATAQKTGLIPSESADVNDDIAIVFCSGTENLACVDATDRVLTNESGDTLQITAGAILINNWS